MYYKGSFKGLYKGLEFPKIRGTLLGGPYNKDSTIWGTTLLGGPFDLVSRVSIKVGYGGL